MKKKVLAITMAALMAASLTACGGGAKETTAAATTAEEKAEDTTAADSGCPHPFPVPACPWHSPHRGRTGGGSGPLS